MLYFQVREMKFTRWVPGLDDTKNNRKLEAAANTTAKKRIGGSAQPSGVLS